MFQIGDLIVYGNTGVCVVEEIGPLDIPGVSKDRLYYTLRPYYDSKVRIFTLVDSTKVVMRPILNREEAVHLIEEIGEIDMLGISNEKKRSEEYRLSLQKCDCKELVRIIKTIYFRVQKRKAAGKKITSQDEKYFHLAEENLFGELAVSLGMDREKVKDVVFERVK